MTDVWDDLGGAKTFENGVYFKGGFSGAVQIQRCVSRDTQKAGHCFLVEVVVLESTSPVDPCGSNRTWFVKMSNKGPALSNIKGFQYAGLGLRAKEPADAHLVATVDQYAKGLITIMTDDSNAFAGRLVHLTTTDIVTVKDKNDFTRHDWRPFDYRGRGVQAPDSGEILTKAQQMTMLLAQRRNGPMGGGYGFGPPPVLGGPLPGMGPALPPGYRLSDDGCSYWAPGMPAWAPVPMGAVAPPPMPQQAPPRWSLPLGAQVNGTMYWAPGMPTWAPIPQ